MNLTLTHAKKYKANGWSVFPVPSGKKEPVIKWGEFRERMASDSEIDAWFGKQENSIGIACGKMSNLSVLDADGITGIQELNRLGLVSPATVITGSGGRHLYFTYAGETNKQTSKDHQGLDGRGEGGYVLAPPSLHASGMKYRWSNNVVPQAKSLHVWPTGLLEKKSTGVTVPSQGSSDPWILKALAGVGSGERHRTLVKLACYLIPRHHYDIVKQHLIDWNLKNTPPMSEPELVKQLNDVAGRFKKGQYVSKFQVRQQEMSHAQNLDIRTTAEAETYFDEQLKGLPQTIPDLPTGFATLDAATWGIKRGSITTIGARPGTGKTTYAVNVASHLCKLGRRVLYFSTEMSHKELYDKFAASEGGVPAFNITTKQFTTDDRVKLAQFVQRFRAYDLHIVNLFRPDEQAVREAVDRIVPDVLIFDHIQHIATGENEYGEISKFTKFLKELSMQTNIGILVASQLHRGAALEGVVPEIHHLKGCGTLEEESSVVILMHDDQKKDDRPILFRVAKNRHGKCGDTTLLFNNTLTKFEDMGVVVS